MYTKELYVTRIKLIALSRIRQIVDSVKARPADYRKDTRDYLDAMYEGIAYMRPERLTEIVNTVREGYAEAGNEDDGYVADSLMSIALAEYQNELGEDNIYDLGWNSWVEDFFRTEIA
ncbi:MAG: hypothetical protein K6F95_03515 [Selenomonas sp.]|uniref:hypothetical protein n=1 Tax=Selenomonas sp. TaxID=2053611 RepID=UPI0025FA6CB2|nr:hypothetical protein [Selenomonas sp.]MCR5756957.1 hypothetical protein [Selenomonas sp.]